MKVTRGLADHKRTPYPVLTIGNFDGQHLGHRALLQAVVATATAREGSPTVLTFDPHPLTVLSPSTPLRLLTTMKDKLAAFQRAGLEEVLVLEFNQAFAALTPEEFVWRILKEGIGARELVVGERFAFGKGRSGSLADLLRLGTQTGIAVEAVPAVQVDGEVVSSTRIRTLIQAGEVRQAARFLGRLYDLEGTVLPGAQRGQELGWPTANLRLPHDRAVPPDGVYATVAIWKKRRFDSVSYIGTRPTFGTGPRLLEVHLLDDQLELYGEPMRVHFVERLRGDMMFQSTDELSDRIRVDVARAREALQNAPSEESR